MGLPDRDRYVPDIALGLRVKPVQTRPPGQAVTTIGLSPMAFGRHGIWPTTLTDIYQNYLDCLKAFVSRLTAEGIKVVLFTTSRMDHTAVEDLLDRLQDLPVAQKDMLAVGKATTLDPLWEVLGSCQLVVASRLHGVILAHRLCVPTLAISFDRKVDAHMEQVGQPDFCLDIRRLNKGDVEERFAGMVSKTHVLQAQLCRFVEAAAPALAAQFDALAGLVDTSRTASPTMSR
jgi:polysaccharide pyruvyl transferase WcaK-like protein